MNRLPEKIVYFRLGNQNIISLHNIFFGKSLAIINYLLYCCWILHPLSTKIHILYVCCCCCWCCWNARLYIFHSILNIINIFFYYFLCAILSCIFFSFSCWKSFLLYVQSCWRKKYAGTNSILYIIIEKTIECTSIVRWKWLEWNFWNDFFFVLLKAVACFRIRLKRSFCRYSCS